MRWRTIILVLIILIGLPLYIWAALTALSLIPGGWPVLAKAPFYLVAGILWAFFPAAAVPLERKDPGSQFDPKFTSLQPLQPIVHDLVLAGGEHAMSRCCVASPCASAGSAWRR